MLLAELFTGCTDVLVRAGVAYSWVEPPKNTTNVGLIMGIRLRPKRCPNVGRWSESEFRRSHTHNRPRFAAKSYGAADNCTISSKASLPKRMAEHNSVRPARAILVRGKTSAKCGLYPESTEKIRADT